MASAVAFTHAAPLSGRRVHASRALLVRRTLAPGKLAIPGGSIRNRGQLVVRAKRLGDVEDDEVKKGKGFRFDSFKQTWVRDSRVSNSSGSDVVIKPKSGGEYLIWPMVYTELADRGLKSISPDEALKRQKKGAVILDVNTCQQFEKEHAVGAINVPLFRKTEGSSAYDNVKRVASFFIGQTPTERDPDFSENVRAVLSSVGKNKEVIVMCNMGGTMKRTVSGSTYGRPADQVKEFKDPERSFGRESRSLKACYELYQAGFKKVVHMEDGLSGWRYGGLGTEAGKEQ